MGRYRVTKAYGPWSKGHVFTDMPGNVARTLIARGLVEPVDIKSAAAPINRMLSAPIFKGRKRDKSVREAV